MHFFNKYVFGVWLVSCQLKAHFAGGNGLGRSVCHNTVCGLSDKVWLWPFLKAQQPVQPKG
ncbi:hypothetical protein HK15_09490 [Acetobacter orientalis]|uniref:Uncharacterized protein n=1 Tax=Acetobacter orientalis TaxID=146474 RepID=A0A252B9R2_9PROT|nr:hypothetical protein HK15_09490 [Acetobacter orientalis]